MSGLNYGDVWKDADRKFWDDMWAGHAGSPMTEAVIAEAMKADRLIEVGCGAGHLLAELVERGWRGVYTGYEIGTKPANATRRMANHLPLESHRIGVGDFVRFAAKGGVPQADLLIARGVVQHHAHWALLPVAALRFVPRVVLGIGYTNSRADRHTGGWHAKGCYDIHINIPLLKIEAAAMGMKVVRCEPMDRDLGGGKIRHELLVVLERGQ